MNELDLLIKEKLVPLRERILESFAQKHPYIESVMNGMLSGKKNRVGMVVTESGKTIGEYTFHTEGLHVASVDCGELSPEIKHPFLGVIKPYAIVEKSTLEKMLNDEERLENDLFATAMGYMPEVTLKFLH
ncbi:hypothetical protein Dtox_1710 [Desulfofarcimen acetoxidans DSM 771]|uniref:Uncharacterized protein n=1 Tax=Desulfofarcimen acetoxidans (strain ATCC 49208 / DSM 771 / KCTC 5769 / VKM B-1644 / 5575) TaxID=485916 RepID=C8VWZ1_DESAS|nr:hypothetical protein [Desulfofarcimen acetoxidans]ACV62567.1 hypothetical protein Dtox_1710 [Desulfofarcimen acetoxidans DSM 771]